MKKTSLKVCLFVFLSLGFISFALAQVQTGSLKGKVEDEQGNPLPGVTISISSPSLLGTREFTTTETGSYRFPALPPGTYTITCKLEGFKTVTRSGIIISVGKTTSIDVVIEPSPIQEEVKVIAESPVVDVKSTKVAITYTKDTLDNLPMNRSIYSIIQTVPGAVQDTWISSASSVHGSVVTGNQYSLDGLNMTSPLTTTPILSVDLSMVEEVEMEIGAHPAEVSNVSGAYINVVSRSGGNAFHGEGTLFYFNESFVDKNLSKEQLDSLGVSSPAQNKQDRDISTSFGGPIFKDRLWFFLAGRYTYSRAALIGFPEDAEVTIYQGMAKLTFQAAKNFKIMSYFNYYKYKRPNYFSTDSRTTAIEATAKSQSNIDNINVQINWILSPNALIDIRGMWFDYYRDYRYRPGATYQNTDLGTGWVTGAYRWEEYIDEGRLYGQAALTLFGDNILGGNHEFKIGAEIEKTKNYMDMWAADPTQTYTLFGSPYVYGPLIGVFYALGYGPEKDVGIVKQNQRSLNFFLQDTWTIKDRLTFNLGVRYDSSRGYLPAQELEEVPKWKWLDPAYFGKSDLPAADNLLAFNTLSPRLGLVYDIFGNGKTIAKASYSRYRDNLQLAMIMQANPNAYAGRLYMWVDLNANKQIDKTDLFILTYTAGRETKDPRKQIDQNAKAPFFDEFIIGIEHELLPNFRFGLSYYNKKKTNIFEGVEGNADKNWAKTRTVTDPGYDGVFGTTDDRQLTVFDRTVAGNQEPMFFTNPRDAWMKYHGLEFFFEKRMSNRWQFLGSIVVSKHWGTVGAEYVNSYSFGAPFDTPNWYINREGRVDTDRPLVLKLQGTYMLPYGINLSAYFIHQSGVPFQRTLSVWAPNNRGYVTVNAEPQGSRREPSRNYMSLRLEKTFTFGSATRLGFFLDVYNALNSAYLSTVNRASVWAQGDYHGQIEADGRFTKSAKWLKVSSVSSPRLVKLGARFSF